MPVARRARSELPADKKLVQFWRDNITQSKTSIRQFTELYKVPLKKVVGIGQRAMVDFREYPFQTESREIVERQWARGEGGKTLGGKARQEGETTGEVLRAWERFVRGGGGTWNYFSYDDPHSMEAFSLFLKLKRQTPMWVFEHLMHESKPGAADGGGIWTKKSSRQLELSFPDGTTCLLQCATAGGKSAGSGSAPRGVWLDEFTKYDPKVKNDFTGMSEGWYDAPGNIFAIWGTGQGNEQYATMFLDHYGRTTPDGFIAHFMSWLRHPDRSVPFRGEEERQAFVATIANVKEFGIAEELALRNAGATPEELNWRRQKLSGPAFKYDLRMFAREYPLVPADMFASESGTVFQIEILKTHDAAARARELSAKVGDFIETGEEIVFTPNRAGSWVLYEDRKDELFYCYGADTASGKVKQTGSNKEADYATAKVKEVYTGRTVARFRAHLEGRAFGHELIKAALYFRHLSKGGEIIPAKGYPEINSESGQATLYRMELELEARGFAGTDVILLQHHPVLSDGKRPEPSLGWRTMGNVQTGGARGRLIDDMKAFIAEVGYFDEGKGTPWDPQFLSEAYCFERDEKGRVEASQGFDDDVFAEMLAVTARDVVMTIGDVPLQSRAKPVVKKPEDALLDIWREQFRQKRDHAKAGAGRSPYLGKMFAILFAVVPLGSLFA